MEKPVRLICGALREKAHEIIADIKTDLMRHPIFLEPEVFRGQHDEMKENAMLALRHLEDARMRLGKVIQYSNDGVSKYDLPVEPAV